MKSNKNKKGEIMNLYRVTDYSTGEVFFIEAKSAAEAAEGFRKEGKPVRVETMKADEQKGKEMETFLVKYTGSDEWIQMQAESKEELAERLRGKGRSGMIKSMPKPQGEAMKTPKVHNKHANTAPADAVYIGRGSKWGNPFVIGKDGNREEVIAKYKQYILANAKLLADLHEIKDKDLVCFCAPQPCHGDVLIFLANNTQRETVKTQAPQAALKKLEKMTPEEIAEITALLEKNVLPHLQSDASNYAKGRQRVWLPYEAPLGNQPFTVGLMDGEVWQWIVDRCAKHGFKAQVALISKGGNIKPHRDTTFAAPWAMGFNLGKCDWHIASARDAAKTDYTMNLNGGEVFMFNSKHVHAVTNAAEDRWAINVWAIANGPAADNANISGRLEKMMDENPELQEFIELHQPGATANKSEEGPRMKEEKTVKLSEKAQKVLSAWIEELDMEPPTPENVAVDMQEHADEDFHKNLWFHTGEMFWTGFGHRYFVYNDFMTERYGDAFYYEGSSFSGSNNLGMLSTYVHHIDPSIVLTKEEKQQIDAEIVQYLIAIGSHESPWVTTNQYVFDFYQTGDEILDKVRWTTDMLTEEEVSKHGEEADERFKKKQKKEKKNKEMKEKTVKLSEEAINVLKKAVTEFGFEPPTTSNVAVDLTEPKDEYAFVRWFEDKGEFDASSGHRYFVFMDNKQPTVYYFSGDADYGALEFIGRRQSSCIKAEAAVCKEIFDYLVSIGQIKIGQIKKCETSEGEIVKAEQLQEQSVNKTDEKKENNVKITPQKKTRKAGPSMIGEIKEYLVESTFLLDYQDELASKEKKYVYKRCVGRVITNDPSYWFSMDKTTVLHEVDRGDYHFALLEHLFGGKSFIVNMTAWNNPINGKPHKMLMSRAGDNPPTDSIFGWADFESETFIRIKDHGDKGWTNLSEYGLHVGNSAKMTKRLVELTKSVRGYAIHKRNDKKLRVKVLTYSDMLKAFPYLKTEEKAGKMPDGVSMLAVETAKYVYRQNKKASKHSKARILNDIDNKKITNHTLRILTNMNGVGMLIKGNALTAPREQINARMVELGFISDGEIYDVFTSVDNCKTELGTDGSFEIVTLEPHHEPGMVKTNDQTMSKFMGIPGMFDPEELLEAFKVVLDNAYNNMVEGKDIQFLENISPLKPRTEAEKIAEIRSSKVTNQVNKMAATLKTLDLPIGSSQTMMLQRANLITKMFLSDTAPEGKNWMAPSREKKSFLLMPWAYRAYIMAKEVVYMLGYDVDLNNMEAQYHPETQTIMVPGVLYDEIMAKLGGGDADDEVMVHIRKMICKDESVRLVAVLIRTPDDWAEYWIIDVDINNMGPVFLADDDDIDLPTIYEKDFDKFKVSSVCGQLPSAVKGSDRPNPETWDWASTVYNFQAGYHHKGQSVGGQVKTKMLYYSTFNEPFDTLPCANEDMIDALQQCKGTMEDLITLNDWSSLATAGMLKTAKLDAYWWHSRNMDATVDALAKSGYLISELDVFGSMDPHESPIVTELMVPRENMVREMYSKMLDWLNNNIMEIPELSICIHKDNQMKFRTLVTELNKMFLMPNSMMYDEYGNRVRPSKQARAKHFEDAAQAVADRFASYKQRLNDDVKFHKFVLSLVRMSWIMKSEAIAKSYDTKNPRHNYDRWLYTAPSKADTIITDYFFEAMIWFRETYKKKS